MNYIVIILMFFFGILDTILLIVFCSIPTQMISVTFVHVLLYFFILVLEKNYLANRGVPTYLMLFIPGLGAFIVAALYFSINYFLTDSIMLNDYEKYLLYESELGKVSAIDYDKEIQTISFFDAMNLLDAEKKKELIVDLTIGDFDKKVQLLQKGILDEDNEVKHYSAAALTMLESEFSNKISSLSEEYSITKDKKTLSQLQKVYKKYIESGLIKDRVLEVINNEYIEVLLEIRTQKKENYYTHLELINAYLRSNNITKAEMENDGFIKNYPNKVEGIKNELYIAYEKKQYELIPKLFKKLGM